MKGWILETRWMSRLLGLLGLYVKKSDIVDNLTRQDTDKPAAQKEVYDLNGKVTAINLKTVVLPWGTYGENTHQLDNAVAIGKTVKIHAGANGRYAQYFTITGWGDNEQVAFMTDTGIIIVSFTDSTHIYVRGTGVTNNPIKVVYILDGLIL